MYIYGLIVWKKRLILINNHRQYKIFTNKHSQPSMDCWLTNYLSPGFFFSFLMQSQNNCNNGPVSCLFNKIQQFWGIRIHELTWMSGSQNHPHKFQIDLFENNYSQVKNFTLICWVYFDKYPWKLLDIFLKLPFVWT